MNHAGIGRIDEECNVRMPIDILSPLSIVDNVLIWGMFYPLEKVYEYDLHKQAKYDFVLSPIPFDLWGKVGRIKVRLKNIPEAHRAITNEIYSIKGSILLSEASRSAHSYDTWTIVITFDDLKDIDYDEEHKAFYQTQQKFNLLAENIGSNCKGFIYTDENDPNMDELVRVTPYSALSYFYHVYRSKPSDRIKGDDMAWSYYKPFCLDGKNNGLLTPDDRFKSILEMIDNLEKENEKGEGILPCKVFAELETNDINIRMALVPSSEEQKFFSASVSFRKSGPHCSSGGFLNHILSTLPKNYSVWRLVNRTTCFCLEREEGRADLIVKDEMIRSNRTRKEEIEYILNKNVPSELEQMPMSVRCRTIGAFYRYEIESSRRSKDKYDVFLSHSSENEREARDIRSLLNRNGFICYMSGKNIKTGDEFTEKIKDGLCGSREVVILYSKQAAASDWVKREFGAAWALGKTITPVVLNMDIGDLPKWLQGKQGCMFHEVETKFLRDLKDR